MNTQYFANASKAKFTIPISIPMAGFVDRKKGNIGTHDSLCTSSIAISDGNRKVVIISNDLLCVDREIVSYVTEGIKKTYGLGEEDIFICASHTHSGPAIAGWDIPGLGKELLDNIKALKDDIKSIILENALKTLDKLKPVNIWFGTSNNTMVTSNRIDPKHLLDSSINVIKLTDNDGKTLSLIINYSCHPTILGAENLYISADYPGNLKRRLEDKFKESVVLFTNGACGDQSTRYTRVAQDFDEAERMGGLLYESVLKALEIVQPIEGNIKGLKEEYDFPVKDLGNYDEALKIYEEAKKNKEITLESDSSHAEKRKAITRYQGAEIMLRLHESAKQEINLKEYIQLIKLGSLLIIGLPVELFVEYGLEIKRLSSFSKTIVACYTNNMLGYVYTPDAFDDRDYEALSSPFAVDTGEYIVNLTQELMISIKK